MTIPVPPVLHSVGAVVSAYAPGTGLVTAVRAVVDQVDALVVVDDGPDAVTPESLAVLERCADLGAVVVRQPANTGIAAALNAGIGALPPSCDAVLTLDQDSLLPAGYVDTLTGTYEAAVAAGAHVGMVAPTAAGNVAPTSTRSGPGDVVIGGEPIQSGLLIPQAVLSAIGGLDERLFIDLVDSELFLRARAHGLVSVVAPIAIEHQLGRTVRVGTDRVGADLTVAATDRYYYQVRNLVLVGRRYAQTQPRWVAGAVAREARHLAVVTALVPGRRARLRRAGQGLRDGLAGTTGRMPRPGEEPA